MKARQRVAGLAADLGDLQRPGLAGRAVGPFDQQDRVHAVAPQFAHDAPVAPASAGCGTMIGPGRGSEWHFERRLQEFVEQVDARQQGAHQFQQFGLALAGVGDKPLALLRWQVERPVQQRICRLVQVSGHSGSSSS